LGKAIYTQICFTTKLSTRENEKGLQEMNKKKHEGIFFSRRVCVKYGNNFIADVVIKKNKINQN